jgi:hypothetical protein
MAISGGASLKSGLGAGLHSHYLVVPKGSDNSTALFRFGSSGAGGEGHLTAIAGLNSAPFLDILYAYQEGELTETGSLAGTGLSEYHLMGTALSATAMDQVFADAVLTGITGGSMSCPNGGTVAGEADRATLALRGWSINF